MCDPDKEVLEVCLFLMTEYRILFLSSIPNGWQLCWILGSKGSLIIFVGNKLSYLIKRACDL